MPNERKEHERRFLRTQANEFAAVERPDSEDRSTDATHGGVERDGGDEEEPERAREG